MSVHDIEQSCNRRVIMEDMEVGAALAKCHPQDQCPLFSTLPREIRDLIWEFATAPIEDERHKYATTEYYYRPGHTARHKTYFDLLLTCRRIWLEANAMPMLQAEQAFWFYRQAPDARDSAWMEKLTPKNRRNFGTMRMFVQMFAIESLRVTPGALRQYFLGTPPQSDEFQPKVFHVTVSDL